MRRLSSTAPTSEQRPTIRAASLLAAAAILFLVSCNNNTPATQPTTSQPPDRATTPPPPGTAIALPEASPEAAKQQLERTTPAAQAIVNNARGLLGLQDTEAACLAQRLDQDPTLRDALGNEPARSPRYNDLAGISQDCIRTTTAAVNFANSIGAQAGGTLDPTTLACLRDAWANLPQSEANVVIEAGLNPENANDPNARTTIDRILGTCNVDRSKLYLPPR